MPETPPPFSPTASHDDTDQGQELDQAKPAGGIDSTAQPASDATPQNTPSKPQELSTAAATPASTQGTGNVLPVSPSARDGPASPPVPAGFVPVTQYRGPDGRLYKQPSIPNQAPKSASSAVLKPLPATTYGESGAGDLTPKGGIDGLSAIPKGWPDLPSNVSLSVEIAWVQSERLRVVKELPTGRVKVDLSKARVPAPSMAALSWLETSIRSYAKFVEVAAKQASSGQDEAEFIRRERMQVGEIRSILSEMMVDKAG